jgi:hypothetical protein
MRPWGRVAHWAVAAVIGVGLVAAIGGPALAWLAVAGGRRDGAAGARTGPSRGRRRAPGRGRGPPTSAPGWPARCPDGVDDRAADTVEGWIAGPLTALPGATGLVVEAAVGPIWVVVDGAPRGLARRSRAGSPGDS